MISSTWALYLLLAALWTSVFSMFSAPVRGYRNLGILASYLLLVPMLLRIGWQSTLATWAVIGIAAGLFYLAYELLSYLKERDAAARPRPIVLLHALLLWPVILPEALEYTLAELGVLRAAAPPELPGAE